MTIAQDNLSTQHAAMLREAFDKQREAYFADPVPTYQQRKEDLLSLKRSGITVADMSRLLGVSRSLIHNRLKSV